MQNMNKDLFITKKYHHVFVFPKIFIFQATIKENNIRLQKI